MPKVNPGENESEQSLSVQRNEKLKKKAQKQMAEDGRLDPNEDPTEPNKHKKHHARDKVQEAPEEGQAKKHDHNKVDSFHEEHHHHHHKKSGLRLDVVVFIVLLADIIGCVALGFEAYVFSLDQDWNSMVAGDIPINELEGHTVFKDKAFQLKGQEYLQKAQEYLERNEPHELVFMVIIGAYILASLVHIIIFYIKVKDVEENAVLLIALYASGGAICIFSSTLPIAASINIENSYRYAVDMLHNFQVFKNEEPTISITDQDKCKDEFLNGCDYYEFAKVQAGFLEKIFELCGKGSRFTHYSSIDEENSVVVFTESYDRTELKEIGFCSRDGFKHMAAGAAIFMGMLFAIVPVIFCCEGKAEGKRHEHAAGEKEKVEVVTEKPPQEEMPAEQPRVKKRSTDMNVILEEFRVYVEKDSGEDTSIADSLHLHQHETKNHHHHHHHKHPSSAP